MAKKKGRFFIQIKREIFQEKYEDLSNNAKMIYFVLNELERRYTGEEEDWFFRSNEDLANDCKMSLATFKRAKRELLDTDLVEHWLVHFSNPKTGKKSEKKVSAYRIL